MLCSWVNTSFICSLGICYCFGSLGDPRLDNKQNTHLGHTSKQCHANKEQAVDSKWFLSPCTQQGFLYSQTRSLVLWFFGSSACCYLSSAWLQWLLQHPFSDSSFSFAPRALCCQFTLSNHWASAFLFWGGLPSPPSTGLKQHCLTPGVSCVSVTELTCHPSCQPFQQCLFHPGGHIPQVFPTHRRKCPSPTFFKSWRSHPFPYSQVMAPVSGQTVGTAQAKYGLSEQNQTSRKHLHTSFACIYSIGTVMQCLLIVIVEVISNYRKLQRFEMCH